ncbi:MFS transporter [Halobiforma nitratireducens]|uniref:Major facilitator superfamily protein n=1 Tax=Halobiforma nitratireducens JCM 10879 TaxID=1227454 RepID=M0LZV4_9EURY|nr:MFS transporter [Halobiforma nitratireducens]EMA38703.1 major facilitator superfamily protein [Halobiforma nitratireducens JCM 10879]
MDVRTAVGDELRALWSDGRGISLVVVASAWGLLVGTRMIYPVVLPYLQDTYGLSLSVAGLLVTVLWLFGSLGQLPGGLLADRYNERTLMAVSTVIVALALGVVVTAASPIALFLATAVWGLGHSLYPIARITFLSNQYTDRLGSALGVTMATGDVGQTILPPIAATIAAAVAWQAGLGFVAPLLFLGGFAIFFTLPTTSTASPSEADEAEDTTSLRDALGVLTELRNPAMGFMAVILFLYIFIWQSFTAFYPTYLAAEKEIAPSTASVLFGLFFAVGVVVKPVAGAAYDRIGMRALLVSVLVPPVAGFALLPAIDSVWLLVGVTALISTMLGSGAITQSYLADSFSEEMQGTGLGVIRTATATLGAGGPVLFGVIAEYGFFDQGYVALAGIMAVVILLTLRMPDT